MLVIVGNMISIVKTLCLPGILLSCSFSIYDNTYVVDIA